MSATVDLTDYHLGIVRGVFQGYSDIYSRTSVFGSRATGRARPNSDLDLVVFGEVEPLVLTELRIGFEESLLPLKVDLLAYEKLSNQRLREHIDRVALPLPLEPALDDTNSIAAE